MSELTPFAGLELLAPGDLLSKDDFRFQSVNPALIDRLLKIGAVTHKHDAAAALGNPVAAPESSVAATGGSIASDLALKIGYTLIDKDGGETLISNLDEINTGPGDPDPAKAPTTEIKYESGVVLANNYSYGVTVTDGAGGESALSPVAAVLVLPGFAHAEVLVGKLKAIAEEVLGKPGEWRLWRSQAGGPYDLLATGTTETYTDKGEASPDCNVSPPEESTIKSSKELKVKVAGPHPGAEFFRLYITEGTGFVSPSLIAQYPVSEFGKTLAFKTLAYVGGAPPPVSTAYPHAQKIDPDTDLIEWHWKRPVKNKGELPALENEEGDVRLVINEVSLYMWSGTEWVFLGAKPTTETHTFSITSTVSAGKLLGPFAYALGEEVQHFIAFAAELLEGEIEFTVLYNGNPVPGATKVKLKAGESPIELLEAPEELPTGSKLDVEILKVVGATKGLLLTLVVEHH